MIFEYWNCRNALKRRKAGRFECRVFPSFQTHRLTAGSAVLDNEHTADGFSTGPLLSCGCYDCSFFSFLLFSPLSVWKAGVKGFLARASERVTRRSIPPPRSGLSGFDWYAFTSYDFGGFARGKVCSSTAPAIPARNPPRVRTCLASVGSGTGSFDSWTVYANNCIVNALSRYRDVCPAM